MPEILIRVRNKIAGSEVREIVCDNTDYTLRFEFDEQWEDGEKTVYFVLQGVGALAPAVMDGDTCPMPAVRLTDGVGRQIAVGVQQGAVRTSTPCAFWCLPSMEDALLRSIIEDEDVTLTWLEWVNAQIASLERHEGRMEEIVEAAEGSAESAGESAEAASGAAEAAAGSANRAAASETSAAGSERAAEASASSASASSTAAETARTGAEGAAQRAAAAAEALEAAKADTKAYIDAENAADRAVIAPDAPGGVASRNYEAGEFLTVGAALYRVTAAIAAGGAVTPGVNVVATTVSEQLAALWATVNS